MPPSQTLFVRYLTSCRNANCIRHSKRCLASLTRLTRECKPIQAAVTWSIYDIRSRRSCNRWKAGNREVQVPCIPKLTAELLNLFGLPLEHRRIRQHLRG